MKFNFIYAAPSPNSGKEGERNINLASIMNAATESMILNILSE